VQPEAIPMQTQPAKATTRRSAITPSMSPIKAGAFKYEQARHLLWRGGFGGTPQQIQFLAAQGPEKAVDHLLDVEKVPYEDVKEDQFDRDIMRPPTREEQQMAAAARRSKDENELARVQLMRKEREDSDREQIRNMQRWWLRRLIETPRPLEEKMVLFWHGHFATSYRGMENSYHLFKQNTLFRKHAVGNFGELLFAIIRDPAMLAYLNNNQSRKGKPNENLAREIMELFSLGIGNYTERDIKEGARALTGYTFADDEFVYRKQDHDEGTKSILGVTGPLDGDGFVKAILEKRACAQYISRKLYKYFVADIPPLEATDNDRDLDPSMRAAINDLTGTMLSSKYAIKPVLRRMFLSEHFYDPRIMNQQIKGPVQLTVGAIRSLNTPVRDLGMLATGEGSALSMMGQSLFFPPSVKGWDGGRSWINTSTLYVRQNILAFLLTGKKTQGYDGMADSEKFDPTPLLAELAKADPGADQDVAKVTEYLLRFTLGSAPAGAKATLLDFAEKLNTGVTRDLVTGMLLLITSMPEYQLC
jgi:uncharacterized protein (DUF1800 family)